MTKPETEKLCMDSPGCNPHPRAPHGFDRNSSHSLGRYVCDCEGWSPDDDGNWLSITEQDALYQKGYDAALRAHGGGDDLEECRRHSCKRKAVLRDATPDAAPDAVAYQPIERDESMDREYIPMPGGWEVQTKGRGSTFRIAGPDDDDRLPIPDSPYLHETLTHMAREVNAAWAAIAHARSAGGEGRE